MSFTITVPATLSNLGPGFDVLGLAIDLANRFEFERVGEPGQYQVAGRVIAPQEDLVCQTVQRAFSVLGGRATSGLGVSQEERIPRERGLGSSATARVAGLAAWAWLTKEPLGLPEALSFLAGEEGHPDNVVPAMMGGLAASTQVDGRLHHIGLAAPASLRIALCIPAVTVATSAARRALPAGVAHTDAVFNLGRLAFLLAGWMKGDPEALRIGVRDRLHHPYRAPLIGPVDEALAAAEEAGAAGAFISGSGSTLAALVLDSGADALAVAQAMSGAFQARGVDCITREARVNPVGAWQTLSGALASPT